MWAAFPKELEKKVEEKPIVKKILIRILTLSFAVALIFSAISYNFLYFQFSHNRENIFLIFSIFTVISIFIGSLSSLLVFYNVFVHIKKIIYELSTSSPRWDLLEGEYIESDIRGVYLTIKNLHATISSQSRLIGIAQIAAGVAHDIRSPLAALDVIIKDIKNLPEEQRIVIRNAANRINDIANNLLSQYSQKKLSNNDGHPIPNSELISDLLMSLISEKRVHYENKVNLFLNLDEDVYGRFAMISTPSFNRVMSNLIDNAIEADANEILVNLAICKAGKQNPLNITIQDNGKGIRPEILQQIINGEIISTKINGHGLGLLNAIKTVNNEWCGQINIKSAINVGTTINIMLPQVIPPPWFLPQLMIDPRSSIVILDDDKSIHEVWKERFKNLSISFNFVHLYHICDLKNWHKNNLSSLNVFLIDYEFIGFSENGLSVIEEIGIAKQSHLVTSRHEDQNVREHSERIGVKIIPKNFAAYIPISLLKCYENKQIDYIFIDDDSTITDVWVLHGHVKGKQVAVYNSIHSFIIESAQFNLHTPVYIDSELNDTMKGQEFAKELYEKGFCNIYLATGHGNLDCREMYWIKEVVGKKPPF